MTKAPFIAITDDTGVLWSSEASDAKLNALEIVHAAEQGNKKGYVDAIGESWTGDLVLVQHEELARVRSCSRG
ncbi:hypothetical protein F6X40_09825 [Paraburkholderia sp. UCT31]|uniref:hypothetical protein n=1 Tax=Paraburkholderia sp. UCT31 TaxID=2615209 RepID=UPI0016554DB7|nr:hypothetical protein [Paraburkholderia sp. UCT31]MBC8737106.1 hypothetical protein [Paraburkholderia sp. UCT31]